MKSMDDIDNFWRGLRWGLLLTFSLGPGLFMATHYYFEKRYTTIASGRLDGSAMQAGKLLNNSNKRIYVTTSGPGNCADVLCSLDSGDSGTVHWVSGDPPSYFVSNSRPKMKYVFLVMDADYRILDQELFTLEDVDRKTLIYSNSGITLEN